MYFPSVMLWEQLLNNFYFSSRKEKNVCYLLCNEMLYLHNSFQSKQTAHRIPCFGPVPLFICRILDHLHWLCTSHNACSYCINGSFLNVLPFDTLCFIIVLVYMPSALIAYPLISFVVLPATVWNNKSPVPANTFEGHSSSRGWKAGCIWKSQSPAMWPINATSFC